MRISELVQRILEQVVEDLNLPDNWDGSGEVREYVIDAVDEIAANAKCVHRVVRIPLREHQSVYLVGDEPLAMMKGVYLVRQQRWLEQTDLVGLGKVNATWLRSEGMPWQFVMLDFAKIMVYPCPSEDGDIIEVYGAVIPRVYEDDGEQVAVGEGWEKDIVDYVIGRLMMRLPNRFAKGMAMYQGFMNKVRKDRSEISEVEQIGGIMRKGVGL